MIKKLPLRWVVLIAAVAALNAGWTGPAGSSRAEAQSAQPLFTAASLKGTCGFNAASTNVNHLSPGFLRPDSSFGTLTFDGVGSVTGATTINRSGKLLAASTTSGSYSVGADGRTGTLDFSVHGGAIYTFVITRAGNEIRYINSGPVDSKSGIVDAVTIANCKF